MYSGGLGRSFLRNKDAVVLGLLSKVSPEGGQLGFEDEFIVAAVVLGEKRGDGWDSWGVGWNDDDEVAAPSSLRTPFMGSEQRCCGCQWGRGDGGGGRWSD